MRPSRYTGQNFLVDRNILNVLIRAADLSSADCVLEVGPGLGGVTERLLESGAHVVAVEKDARLLHHLRQRFGRDPRLDIIGADILSLDLSALLQAHRVNRVVSTLPYSIATRFLAELALIHQPPERLTITVQKEVADRLAAEPASRDYGMITVWSRLVYGVTPVRRIPPSCFWPKPKVESVILNMNRYPDGQIPPLAQRCAVHALTKVAFAHRRKQLAVTLTRASPLRIPGGRGNVRVLLSACGLPEDVRPEALAPADWLALVGSLPETARRTSYTTRN